MTRRDIREVVVSALVAQAGAPHTVPDETPLFEAGLDLDSIRFLEAVLAIERETGLSLRGEDLTADAIATVGSMVDHVASLLP